MGILRNSIVDKARSESQKNVNVFFKDIARLEITNTHAVAWIPDRYTGDKDHMQKIQLINADTIKSHENELENYGILVLQTTPGRYAQSFGMLIRKEDWNPKKNEATNRMPSMGA